MTTRDELVKACAELIAQEGAGAFSLRKVAERVGIKAPSIYVHFASKEALLAEASQLAAGALGEFLAAACRGDNVHERLVSTALGYLRFADEQPSLFALLFMELPSARRSLDEPPDPASPYMQLLAQAREFVGDDPVQAELLSFGIWALVHGAAVLRRTHLRDFAGPLAEGTRLNVERLLDGWQRVS